MSIKKILKYPNLNLQIKSKNILSINNNIIHIIKDMIDTMYYYNGIGISAPQINILKNIIVVNVNEKYKQTLVIINPKIIYNKEKIVSSEGCLSFPGIFINIKRKKNIKIQFISIKNNNKIIKINNLLSICVQHEIDHLNGITLYNRMSNLKKNIYFKKK